jgi:hypothetical protein
MLNPELETGFGDTDTQGINGEHLTNIRRPNEG